MSDANKTSFYFKEEASFGAQASGSGAFAITPTSDSLGHTQGFTQSQRIRDDRQIDDTIRNAIGAGGDIAIEWSFERPYHELVQAAMQHDYTGGVYIGFWDDETQLMEGLSIECEVTDTDEITTNAGTWDNAPTVGNFVKVNGFYNAANNGLFEISAAAAGTLDVTGATLVVEGTGSTIRITEYTAVLATGTATATSTQFTHATGFDNTPTVNDWLWVSGFSTAGNNGYFKVTAASSTAITVSPSPTGGEAAVTDVSIVSLPSVTNGVYMPSFTVERVFNDAVAAGSDLTDVFTGMCVSGMSMSVTPDGPVTGAFSFVGKKQSSAGTATIFTSPNPQAGTRIFNGVDYVTSIWLGGTAVTLTSLEFSLDNNLRARNVIGQLGPLSMGSGTVGVSGTVRLYNADNVEYAKALADTESTLAFVLEDDDTNAYVWDFPKVRYGDLRRVAGGINTDVIVDLPFQAIRHPEENVTLRVAKR